jgi:dihydropteroate synthase
MGILNVTPDSFSDGGLYSTTEAAVVRGREMVSEGADVLDVGGESTRPGARPVAAIEQIQRVVPVIRRMRSEGVTLPISIDTRSAAVAAAALDAGADIVNDISAARHDSDMPRLLAERRVPFVAMHMQGTPETMQLDPRYGDVVAEVRAFFIERAETLAAFGVDVSRMMVDPGIGFGKKLEHNLALLRAIGVFRDPWPVLIGPSRKRFIGELIGQTAADRLIGTAAVVAHCALAGVDLVRVHDVEAMKSIIHVCSRLAEAE